MAALKPCLSEASSANSGWLSKSNQAGKQTASLMLPAIDMRPHRRRTSTPLLADDENLLAVAAMALPPFALWPPDDFEFNVHERGYIPLVAGGSAWSANDLGLGTFASEGLIVFKARMGDHQKKQSAFTGGNAAKLRPNDPSQFLILLPSRHAARSKVQW